MLLEKYKPHSLKNVIGNSKQIMEIKGWLAKWKLGDALIIYGPPGCGKSLCVELIAAEGGYELVKSHAADERGYKELKASILKASSQQSLFYRKKLILIDELELIDSVKGVMEIVQESKYPVILITSNPYEQKLASLRKRCTLCKFDKIRSDSIDNFLALICKNESIECEKTVISQLSKMSNGDVRAAIIDLECASPGSVKTSYRDKEENIFETLKILFKTLDINNSKYAIETSEKTPEEIFFWVEENITREYESLDEIASAYDYLSKADIVATRIIRRQSWTLQKYYIDFLCGVSFAKEHSYKKFTAYGFPNVRFRQPANGIIGKIAKKLHVSAKEALQYTALLAIIKNKKVLSSELGLEEGELETLD